MGKKKGIIIEVVLGVIVIAIMLFTLVKLNKYARNRCIKNPPSIVAVEERLGNIFLTTQVTVIDVDNEGDSIIYTVTANGFYYKVRYSIKQSYGSWIWYYERHAQIKGE